MVQRGVLHVHRLRVGRRRIALAASDGTSRLWPLGHVLADPADAPVLVAAWLERWEEASGERPAMVVCSRRRSLGLRREVLPAGVEVVGVADAGLRGHELGGAHRADREALRASLAAVRCRRFGQPADLVLDLLAIAVLRVWGRWLRGFSGSSTRFLLDSFVRRSGAVVVDADGLTVDLEPRPHDVVMEIAGYTAELDAGVSLGRGRIRFAVGGR
jgi:hypothetical protein